VDDVVVDAVFRVRRDRFPAEDPAGVRLVLAEQDLRRRPVGPGVGDQLERPEERVLDRH
jgi:hypothetical protein